MADIQSPLTLPSPSPPPPPSWSSSSSSSSSKTGMTMLYYGLAVVGTAAIVLAMYNLIIIRRCSRRHRRRGEGEDRAVEVVIGVAGGSSSRSFECSNRNLLSSFRYKKETEEKDEGIGGGEYECPVCLMVFEEGEEVKKLPRCNHSFHAVCIDMWLYSHLDCPICRTHVGLTE